MHEDKEVDPALFRNGGMTYWEEEQEGVIGVKPGVCLHVLFLCLPVFPSCRLLPINYLCLQRR